MFQTKVSSSHSLRDKSDFQIISQESLASGKLQKQINTYMLLKLSIQMKEPDKIVTGIQDFFTKTTSNHTVKSLNIIV